jgi:hypothetical protein
LLRPQEASRRVPWLEPEEDDDEGAGAEGLDSSRILAVLLGGLALVTVLGGGLWWLLGAEGQDAVVADGSIIEAPEGPYKVRPSEDGGVQVAGTGDVSFAIAEGEVREGYIAGEDSADSGIDSEASSSEDEGDGEARSDGGESAGGVGVQIGAFPSEAEARAAWGRLGVRIPALAGRSHRILEGSADSGAVFRLQAVAGSAADAQALCAAIREDGGDCQVK